MKKLSILALCLVFSPIFLWGQLGIGTTTPEESSMLDVTSISKGILIPRMTAGQRDAIASPVNGLLVFVTDDNTFYFYSNSSWIPVFSAIKTDDDWVISGNNMYSGVTGKIGIGTTHPQEQLEITQSFRMSSYGGNTGGILFKGNYRFLHDFFPSSAIGYNTFLGRSSGNLTMSGTGGYSSYNTGIGANTLTQLTTGWHNTAVGYHALYANNSGEFNTAAGTNALSSNTTGSGNTAYGVDALEYNLTGQVNTVIGGDAARYNSTGNNNVVIGALANYYNQTGSNNTILGFQAGSGTAYHNKSGNVFIGYNAGYYETGSNKLYIENSDATTPLIGGDFSLDEVWINGKLGIGTSAPATKLHVAGSVRIADGTEGGGRILESDALGNTMWVDPTSVSDGDWTVNGNDMYSEVSGNVGIGTSSPTQKLEIDGSVALPQSTSATDGVIYKGGFSFMHDFKASTSGSIGQNTFLGKNAGNFTLTGGSTWESSDNTGIGTSSLHKLTNGYANTAVGSFCMSSLQGGDENTAVGLYSMYAANNGIRNSSFGAYAMKENTSGNYNVAVGFDANRNNETGTNNTIIGYAAGRGSSTHSKSGNVFIGYNAGYNETGSNKLYIENSNSSAPLIGGDFSSDQVYINGKMGIGTSSPAASSILDLSSTNKGFLLPRMTGAQRTGIGSPVDGLMVYDSDADAVYAYCKGVWQKALTGSSGWSLTGNSGTNPSANFIGTTDNVVLNLRVNNSPSGLIDHIKRDVGLGYQSLNALAGGQSNTAIGHQAMNSIIYGHSNTAIGCKTMYAHQTGYNNVAVGDSAMFSWAGGTSSYDNTAVGSHALSSLSNGIRNTALGSQSLMNNTSGQYNTALGVFAMSNSTTGSYNVAAGESALYENSSGSENIAIGSSSLRYNTIGQKNVAVGSGAMNKNKVGAENIGIGTNALCGNDSSNYNTHIGCNNYASYADFNNTSALGYHALPAASNRIHIGNTAVTWIGGQVGWSTYSDERVKKNVSEDIHGLDFILSLRPVLFQYDVHQLEQLMGVEDPGESAWMKQAKMEQGAVRYSGFIAQEVEQAAKQCGYAFSGVQAPVNEHTPYTLRYASFVVPLVKAVQEQEAVIDQLRKENSELRNRLDRMEEKLNSLDGVDL